MSVINQALKKAQRQQLVHGTQRPFALSPLHAVSRRRRLRVFSKGSLACVLGLLGGGVAWHIWMTPLFWQPAQPALSRVTSASPAPVVQSASPQPVTPPQPAPPVAAPGAMPSPIAPVQASPLAPRLVSEIPSQIVVTPTPVSAQPGSLTGTTAALASRAQPEELLQRALSQQAAGNVSQARALLEQVVALDPNAKFAYNSLGNLYYQQRQYHQAVAMYAQVLAIDPNYVKARNNLGSTYMRLQMDSRALEELQQALEIDATYSLTHYNLACVYARAGDGLSAARYLQQAIDREPQARNWAQNDTDFTPVRTAPEMQHLLGGVH